MNTILKPSRNITQTKIKQKNNLKKRMGTKTKEKVIFVNVDTQKDFMMQNTIYMGTLYVPSSELIQNTLQKLTNFAWRNNIKTLNTADWHNKETKEISDNPDFKKTFPKHCIEDTIGSEYISATKPQHTAYKIDWRDKNFDKKEVKKNREIIIYKDAFDVFVGNPHTDKIIETINPKEAIVYGVAADVCVDYVVRGLVKKGIKVYVPLDCVKELNSEDFEKQKNEWKDMGVKLTTFEEITNKYKNKKSKEKNLVETEDLEDMLFKYS